VNHVEKGAIWSMSSTPFGGRHRFRILSIRGTVAIIKLDGTGRETTIALSVLHRGSRGSRIEVTADGKVIDQAAHQAQVNANRMRRRNEKRARPCAKQRESKSM
jgi:hypothetical protein